MRGGESLHYCTEQIKVIKEKSIVFMRKGRDRRLLRPFEVVQMREGIEPVVYQAHGQKDQNNNIEDDAGRGDVV